MRSIFIAVVWLSLLHPAFGQGGSGRVRLTILDQKAGQVVPGRVHLKDSQGQPVRAGSLPFFRDHFVGPGTVDLELLSGEYRFEIERGPEYSVGVGRFAVEPGQSLSRTVPLERLVDLAAEGWWSGDLHVHRPVEDLPLLMQAEDLHVAPVITWWNNQNLWAKRAKPESLLVTFDQNRAYHVMGGEDEREGGALLYFNLAEPLSITGATREYPSPLRFLAQARQQAGVWVDIEKPFWWDVPLWLADGRVDSVGLANNHMCREQMYENEAWGRPRDAERLPPPRGNGFWTQEVYYHILNCGLRVPPSAGSASGVLPNPVGYNRVYVYLGPTFSWDKWWEGLRAGRSFVSNGPLLRCQANGAWPGQVFRLAQGKSLPIEIQAALTAREAIAGFEIVQNGQVVRTVPFADWKKTGTLGTLECGESGWFLIRVITDQSKTFRFASTAPFYVEAGDMPHRISAKSARFFLDWVRERKARVKLNDPKQRAEVLPFHEMAEKYWSDRVSQANAE